MSGGPIPAGAPGLKVRGICQAWAENLEAARAEIISRWGEGLYRRLRLYLWGSPYAFLSWA
jgi:cyclopropane fatty-acyl-phospholipid synthase-like methyltransferase